MEAPAVITGWDLSDGGGPRARFLPDEPRSLVLAEARANFVPGEAAKEARFELWGLDPRLTVALSFGRPRNPSLPIVGAISNVITPPATLIGVSALGRFGRDELVVASLDATLLFTNGAVIGMGEADGCEITTAAEGLRFIVPLIRTGDNSIDFAVNLVVRPNHPLGCRELALALAEGLTVRGVQKIVWDGAP